MIVQGLASVLFCLRTSDGGRARVYLEVDDRVRAVTVKVRFE